MIKQEKQLTIDFASVFYIAIGSVLMMIGIGIIFTELPPNYYFIKIISFFIFFFVGAISVSNGVGYSD